MLDMKSKQIYLQELKKEDFDQFYQIYKDNNVTNFLSISNPLTFKDGKKLFNKFLKQIKNKERIIFGIYEINTNKLTGTIVFNDPYNKNRFSEIGYSLGTEFQRKGYIEEAIYLMYKFGFEVLKLNRIESRVNDNNIPSLKLQKKIGMTYEGTLRLTRYNKDKFHNLAIFSILKNEF